MNNLLRAVLIILVLFAVVGVANAQTPVRAVEIIDGATVTPTPVEAPSDVLTDVSEPVWIAVIVLVTVFTLVLSLVGGGVAVWLNERLPASARNFADPAEDVLLQKMNNIWQLLETKATQSKTPVDDEIIALLEESVYSALTRVFEELKDKENTDDPVA